MWDRLPSYFKVPEGLTGMRAREVMVATTFAPERRDFIDRSFYTKPPYWRVCIKKFREDGVLIPFGSSRDEFDTPNPYAPCLLHPIFLLTFPEYHVSTRGFLAHDGLRGPSRRLANPRSSSHGAIGEERHLWKSVSLSLYHSAGFLQHCREVADSVPSLPGERIAATSHDQRMWS